MRGLDLLRSLLNSDDYAWHAWSEKPKPPALKKGGEAYRLAVEEVRRLEAESQPAPVEAFSAILYKLQGHYWTPNMSEALARSVAQDYQRLLGKYPVDILQAACDDWLLNPTSRFFPKVGELEQILKEHQCKKNGRKRKIQLLIDSAS